MNLRQLFALGALGPLGVGCGQVGLESYSAATATTVGAEAGGQVILEPSGDIDFDVVSTADPAAVRTATVRVNEGGAVFLFDIYLGDLTSSAFSLGEDDLPLPLRMEPDSEFPFNILFAPTPQASSPVSWCSRSRPVTTN